LDYNNNSIVNKNKKNQIDIEKERKENNLSKNKSNDVSPHKLNESKEDHLIVEQITEIEKIILAAREETREEINDILTKATEKEDDRSQTEEVTINGILNIQEPEKYDEYDERKQQRQTETLVEKERKEEPKIDAKTKTVQTELIQEQKGKKKRKSKTKKSKDENHNVLNEFEFKPKYSSTSQSLVFKSDRKRYFNW